jgi:1-acyl-sn-glycerol-3-phosphate acyltransferase
VTVFQWLRSITVAFITTILMILAVVVMAVARAVTLGGGRRFSAEVVARSVARAFLWMAGVRVVLHQSAPFPAAGVIYTANHSSTLDLFILIAMGLPRTRYFMKRASWLFPPVGATGALIGTFFTPPQTLPAARARCFQAAERKLRETGDSVYLSPEGTRITTGGVGPFNKGTFHLATALGAPIVPLFFAIPRSINPGKGVRSLPGTVHVHVLPTMITSDWRLDDLVANKERVRDVYVAFSRALSADGATPGGGAPPGALDPARGEA